ncbi:MAG: putative Ig domain-containing protein [Thiobacillus sp.]|nr:putative Ig domain-containing protein [Thiobacillus sp.]
MKTQLLPMSQLTQALLLAGLVAVAAPASAVEFWLRAETLNVTMPGSATPIPMWGYASCTDGTFTTCAAATVPGPALTVLPGDPVLTIHLRNTLPADTSIVIPSQTAAMTPVWDDGSSGPRPSASARVRSFTHETPAGAADYTDYTWSSMKPGTYLYHSGTHPQVQVQMGLYGGVSKDAATGEAYAGVAYDNELMLLYSEIDPRLHEAVANGTYGTSAAPSTPECPADIQGNPGQLTSALCYQPQYFLINGKPFEVNDPPLPPLATLAAGERTLLRFLNAGLQTHVPVINGIYMQMIAEDGNPYPWPANPRQQYSVLLPAAKTVDAIITPAEGTYPVFDRRLNLVNAASQDGGMLAFLEVTGGATNAAPSITSTAITTATVGQPYGYDVNATDPDAGDVLTYSLDVFPAGMTINGTTGLISWTPGAAGPSNVTVQVSDGSLSDTQSFVIDAQAAVAPVLLYFSTATNIAVPGVSGTADNADVYSWDGTSFVRVLDATAEGLPGGANVDGLKVVGSQIYLSFNGGVAVPGLGTVQDEDIVVYDTGSGTWSLFFDGTALGLTTDNEDVDAFDILSDGSVLISTLGGVAVPGLTGTWADEDVLRCAPTSNGPIASCTWSVHFDGSDVGLSTAASEDIDGVSVGTGKLYLSTIGAYSVSGGFANATNAGGDVFSCNSPVTGAVSSCASFSLYFRASDHGLTGNLDAVSVP